MAYVRYRNVSSNGSRRCKEPMMTVKEVAAELRVSAKFVYSICQKGALECHKIGGRIRIQREAMEAYLSANKNGVTQLQPSTPRKPTLKHLRLR